MPRIRPSLFVALSLLLSAMTATNEATAQQGPPPVVTASPLVDTVVDWDEYTGRFVAQAQVDIRARVSGYLDGIHFDEGQIVEAGQLLYTIDRRPFDLAVRQAHARVDAAAALRDLAIIEFERAEELEARNVGSTRNVQQARSVFQEAVANIALAEAQLEEAELNLEYTRITAPIHGRISTTALDVGDLVVGGPNGADVLTDIVRVDPIEFVFTGSEADFLKYARLNEQGIAAGDRDARNPVQVQLLDEDDWPWVGYVDFVDNVLDPNSGTITARGVFENDDGFLQPGLFGRARLPGSGEYEAVLIPAEAIVADQSRSIVYVVGEEDIIEARPVTPGALWKGLRIVRDGLTPEDRVVVSGLQRVRPGSPVTPVDEPLTLAAGN
ncbi:MAG: efflux RND transporter periplasmic adaptor subunit [Pseudomonadota bacterium]